MTTKPQHIVFIGAGNMASAIIGGLVQQDFRPQQITACAPSLRNLEPLQQQFDINISHDNSQAQQADVVVLSVKPQMLQQVATELRPYLAHQPLIISVAAGVTVDSLQQWLGEQLPIIRSMPNTPSLVGVGAAGLFANGHCQPQHKDWAEQISAAVGMVQWLDHEALIDAVIAVSGSGPAYFFLAMEAMIEEGVQQGLSPDTARQLTIQTVLGAATLAQHSDCEMAELRRRVTSPGGTTEQAIQYFENNGLRGLFAGAMRACAKRAQEMALLFK